MGIQILLEPFALSGWVFSILQFLWRSDDVVFPYLPFNKFSLNYDIILQSYKKS